MVDVACRVALLARPGAARDCVRDALTEVGAVIVAEDDPVSADPDTLLACAPQVLMVVLDPTSEDALGRFDAVLGDPGIEVMFEEAEVATAREGWESARWRRHLAAKLNHRSDVLPPVAGAGEIPAVDALSVQIDELISTDASGFLAPTQLQIPDDAIAGDGFSIFDPASGEPGGDIDGADDLVLTVHGLEFDSTALDGLPPVTGSDYSASDFDPLLAELDLQLPDTANESTRDWEGGLVEDFSVAAQSEVPSQVSDPLPAAPEPPAKTSFGDLSLTDDVMPAHKGESADRFKHDIGDLERRIASLELVDDAAAARAAAPAATGVLLVLAGVGGPDAVRQLLKALPKSFPRAVLVRQRLDGARYDKLVAQVQRATSLTVMLATPGDTALPGTVYMLDDTIGLSVGDGLRFNDAGSATLLDALDAADSAIVVLSGADSADVSRIAALHAAGAYVGAQTADGCYDAEAANAVSAQGAASAAPAELARQIAARWNI